MGTRCYIAKQVGPDQYRTIYCQIDGYLEEVGANLAGYYDSEAMVDKLLDLGDIYTLQPKLSPDPAMEHSEANSQKGVTLAYGRDMGVNDWPATIKSMDTLMDNDQGAEFLYIFDQNQKWQYFGYLEMYDEMRDLKETLVRNGIPYRPEDQGDQAAPEQSDNGEEETYEQKM